MSTQSSSQNTQGWKTLGFNYTSWWNGKFAGRESAEALTQMAEIGADTSTIVSTSFLDNIHSSEIYATEKTESLANVEQAIIDSKNAGLEVWLKPHIDTDGTWRGMIDPSDRHRFFQNYKDYLLDYAHLAQEHGVEALVIGTELTNLTKPSDRGYWLDVIHAVREVYDGQLTYAANWDTADQIPFVDAIDFIGVDAYYPLTDNRNATVDDLVRAWTETPEHDYTRRVTGGQSVVDWLQGIAESAGKSIVFTEIGFRSLDGNAALSYDYASTGTIDFEEQVRLYEAFFQVFGDEPWFDGAQLWTWYATAHQNQDQSDTDYAILDKPAEAVFRHYAEQLLSGAGTGDWPSDPATPTDPVPPTDPVAPENPAPTDDLGNIDALDIAFEVSADWGNGFSGNLLVTNTGDTPIQDWTLAFEAPYTIGETWNAAIADLGNGHYQASAIASAPWNVEIAPGETISFGFVGNAATPSAPTDFTMTGDGLTGGESPTPPTEPTPPTAPEPPTEPEVPTEPTPPSEPQPPTDGGDTDALDVNFDVLSDWGNGFSANVEITNTSSAPLQNWTVEFTTDYALGGTWNAHVESLGDNRYRATASADAPWNHEIQPGETLSFGFSGNADTPTEPINFVITNDGEVIGDDPVAPLPTEPESPPTPNPPTDDGASDALGIDFAVSADWGNGFSGDVQITNLGDTVIDNWSVEFETEYPLGDVWNANITPLGNQRYRATALTDTAWNADIDPGETISFGFVGEAETPTAPSNYAIAGDGLTTGGTGGEPVPAPTAPVEDSDPLTGEPSTPAPGGGTADPLIGDIELAFQVTADWGSGFSGDLLITNSGDTAIADWSLGFDTAYTLGDVWNADIQSLGSRQYQAQATSAAAWNAEIAPGETISFGFVGNAETPSAPTNFEFTTDDLIVAINAAEPSTTSI